MMTHMDYAGICPKCGALCCCVADLPGYERETAKEVARWIREGLIVERVTIERIRAEITGCKCKQNQPKQQEMF